MIDHEQIVSFMLRLKYSLNIQKPESLTCENIKLPAPKDKTIKFGFAPVCVTKGITTPAAVNAAINAFNRELLAEHLRTCVTRDLKNGHEEIVDELAATLQKLMK